MSVYRADGEGSAAALFESPDADAIAASLGGESPDQTNGADGSADLSDSASVDAGVEPDAADSAAATADPASDEEQLDADSGEGQEGAEATPAKDEAGASTEEDTTEEQGDTDDGEETPPATHKKWNQRLTQKSQQVAERERTLQEREERLQRKLDAWEAVEKRLQSRAPEGRERGAEDDPFAFEDGAPSERSAEGGDLAALVQQFPGLRPVLEDFAQRQQASAAQQQTTQQQAAIAEIREEIAGVAEAFGIQKHGAFGPAQILDTYQLDLSDRLGRQVTFEEAAEHLQKHHPEYFKAPEKKAPKRNKKPAPKNGVLPGRGGTTPSTGSGSLSELGTSESKRQAAEFLAGTY